MKDVLMFLGEKRNVQNAIIDKTTNWQRLRSQWVRYIRNVLD